MAREPNPKTFRLSLERVLEPMGVRTDSSAQAEFIMRNEREREKRKADEHGHEERGG